MTHSPGCMLETRGWSHESLPDPSNPLSEPRITTWCLNPLVGDPNYSLVLQIPGRTQITPWCFKPLTGAATNHSPGASPPCRGHESLHRVLQTPRRSHESLPAAVASNPFHESLPGASNPLSEPGITPWFFKPLIIGARNHSLSH